MRIVAVLAMFMLVAGVFCGGGSTAPQSTKADTTGAALQQLPEVACAPLESTEMGPFLKAVPGVGAALKAANWKPEQPGEDEGIATALPKLIDGMKSVPGVEDALKKAGTNWDAFRATLYKISAASAALGVDMAASMTGELEKDTSAMAKKALKQLTDMKAVCSKVPEANKQMVTKYQKELESLKLLGE